MNHRSSNRFIMIGVAVVIASIVLMDLNARVGIVANVLHGASILDTDLEVRWPVLVGFGLICWGCYKRLNSA